MIQDSSCGPQLALDWPETELPELPRPWLFQFPWFPVLTIGSEARDLLRGRRQELGEERFWEELWELRDAEQRSVRVKATSAWPWIPAKVRAAAEAEAGRNPGRIKVVVGRGQG